MTDERIKILAGNLVTFSCNVQRGEHVLIENIGGCDELTIELIKKIYRAGGIPFVWELTQRIRREMLLQCSKEQFELMAERDIAFMSKMQCYIGIRGGDNSSELSDVPSDKMRIYQKTYWHPVHSEIRVRKTKWVVLRYPTPSMAQQANCSTQCFEDYYFNVCNLDYSKMDHALDPLKKLMERTDKVRLTAKGTDITFSIKGIKAIKCAGHMNIPDGEIYTAPVKTSVNGVIQYNTPSLHDGFTYTDIRFVFKDGKIVEASANDPEKLSSSLDIDAGARFIGEFAIGVHPYIVAPMKDTLFDEKIAGSIHFTPGNAYDDADNGNRSALHWDLVLIQTKEYGGGEIYFDDVLVRKDGLFVLPELISLNPENLK